MKKTFTDFTLECNELCSNKTKYVKIDYTWENICNMNNKYTQYTKSF